jgi:hypothetical protein
MTNTVAKLTTGRYRVTMPGMAGQGNPQAVALGTSVVAWILGWAGRRRAASLPQGERWGRVGFLRDDRCETWEWIIR